MMRLLAAALLAVLGLALTAQVQTRQDDESLAGYREQDLLSLVTGLGGSTARTQRDLAELRRTQEELRGDLADARLALAAAEERTGPLSVLAGTAPAEGPGVVVRVLDPDARVPSELLLDLVQDLRAAGAEAIEVNGRVRLGAGSWFAGEAGGLVVDGVELERPYVLEVVGRTGPLEGALVFPQGGADRMRERGAVVTGRVLDQVEVESTRGPGRLRRAEPVGPTLPGLASRSSGPQPEGSP